MALGLGLQLPALADLRNRVALVLERNKLVNRRIGRVLGVAGFEVRAVEEPERLEPDVCSDGALVLADAFDVDLVTRLLASRPACEAVLYSGEPVDRLLPRAAEEPRLRALVGRAGFEVAPRESDLLMLARLAESNAEAPALEAHLSWGARISAFRLTELAHRDPAVAEVMAFVTRLGAPKRVGDMLGELTHELIMNALYDAPVDASGQPRFAHDRKAEVRLDTADAALLRVGSDGMRVAVEVTDRFGRLTREHVFGGIHRALASGQIDAAGGGAGLGMMVAYRSTTALYFDVIPGRRTRVIGLFDLDLNLREFRLLPKTLHFPRPRS